MRGEDYRAGPDQGDKEIPADDGMHRVGSPPDLSFPDRGERGIAEHGQKNEWRASAHTVGAPVARFLVPGGLPAGLPD
jgi:hypothetical protein